MTAQPATTQRPSLMDSMAVDIPEGRKGNLCVERFDVTRDSLENMRLMFQPGNRSCRPGVYTRLLEEAPGQDDVPEERRRGTLWMSDTTAERRDHLEAAMAMRDHGGHVLIGGLGLGMIVRCALLATAVEHVEVLERNPDVVALVGPHYERMAEQLGKQVTIRTTDALTWEPPKGAFWSVVYFDIWPDLCDDNLPEMATLGRRFDCSRERVRQIEAALIGRIRARLREACRG